MKISATGKALVVALVFTFIGTFLLTPLGFETRPVSAVHPLGLLALVLVFLAAGANLLAILLLSRRPQWAARLAAAGPFLFAPGLVLDQSGNFSSFAPSVRITGVEYVQFVLELVAAFLAYYLYREWSRSGVPRAEVSPATPEN